MQFLYPDSGEIGNVKIDLCCKPTEKRKKLAIRLIGRFGKFCSSCLMSYKKMMSLLCCSRLPSDQEFCPASHRPTVLSVLGIGTQRDDLVVCGNPNSTKALIFFGGDLQDLKEVMKDEPECAEYINWSLEKTSKILHEAFPETLIIVVRPSRKQDVVFSCFDHFVRSTPSISPSRFDPEFRGLEHLDALLTNLTREIDGPTIQEVQLVGFSKGGVVLNQFVYEFSSYRDKSEVPSILSKINVMSWLDSGHWGPPELWITNRGLLESLKRQAIEVQVVTTPYQTGNPQRPNYKAQLERFCETCEELGVAIAYRHIFARPYASITIENHFQTISEFVSTFSG